MYPVYKTLRDYAHIIEQFEKVGMNQLKQTKIKELVEILKKEVK